MWSPERAQGNDILLLSSFCPLPLRLEWISTTKFSQFQSHCFCDLFIHMKRQQSGSGYCALHRHHQATREAISSPGLSWAITIVALSQRPFLKFNFVLTSRIGSTGSLAETYISPASLQVICLLCCTRVLSWP